MSHPYKLQGCSIFRLCKDTFHFTLEYWIIAVTVTKKGGFNYQQLNLVSVYDRLAKHFDHKTLWAVICCGAEQKITTSRRNPPCALWQLKLYSSMQGRIPQGVMSFAKRGSYNSLCTSLMQHWIWILFCERTFQFRNFVSDLIYCIYLSIFCIFTICKWVSKSPRTLNEIIGDEWCPCTYNCVITTLWNMIISPCNMCCN